MKSKGGGLGPYKRLRIPLSDIFERQIVEVLAKGIDFQDYPSPAVTLTVSLHTASPKIKKD